MVFPAPVVQSVPVNPAARPGVAAVYDRSARATGMRRSAATAVSLRAQLLAFPPPAGNATQNTKAH